MGLAALDLRRVVRERLFAAIELAGAASAPPHTALLVDRATLRVLSRGVRMSELLHHVPKIALIDMVHSTHEAHASAPTASMDVTYFLEPTAESVELALAHHEEGSPSAAAFRGAVHFIFSRRLPDELLERIRDSPAAARMGTLRELHLQFVPLRPAAFSLDTPGGGLAMLYGPSNAPTRAHDLDVLAEQVGTLYGSLSPPMMPRVRYASQTHPVCRTFAERLDRRMRQMGSASPPTAAAAAAVSSPAFAASPSTPSSAASGRRAVLLVLDRR